MRACCASATVRSPAEAFEHEIVDTALLGELDRGLDAIARIASAGTDPDGPHYFSPK